MRVEGLDTTGLEVVKDCPDDNCPAFLLDRATATAYVVGEDPVTGREVPVRMPLGTLENLAARIARQ